MCDFKGHCVAVFSDDGTFKYRIGNEKITCFPNGIDISDAGDILIGDSHGNRFHVACFSRDGVLQSEYECPYVKVGPMFPYLEHKIRCLCGIPSDKILIHVCFLLFGLIAGLSMLRLEDNIGGFCGDAGKEQSSRVGLEYALHPVIICQSKNSQTKSLNASRRSLCSSL